ncbi:FecCD family ABC transporter permease [Streptomyces sp. NPDC051018]|uniref:FecCD family ABC transporter permease n=1 Tax=Streptomyces sp. NPDC051018 TaxID=3365639 RepID=UPI00379FF984
MATVTRAPLGGVSRPGTARRALGLLAGLLLLALALFASVMVGSRTTSFGDVLDVLSGSAGPRLTDVVESRYPRTALGVLAGTGLAVAGTLMQGVTRNPLAEPGLLGINAGASAGIVTGAAFWGAGGGTAGVAAICTAFTQYVVYAMERDNATVLTAYVNGSLTARSWQDAATIGLVLLVALPATALLTRRLGIGEMGDDIARGLGSDPRNTRTYAVVPAIVLSAGAVGVAGPIAFISLTAPQTAKRLTRVSGPHLLLSGLTGALLLVLADLCAQQLPLLENLPVGIHTMAIGRAYLGFLLTRERRRGKL